MIDDIYSTKTYIYAGPANVSKILHIVSKENRGVRDLNSSFQVPNLVARRATRRTFSHFSTIKLHALNPLSGFLNTNILALNFLNQHGSDFSINLNSIL